MKIAEVFQACRRPSVRGNYASEDLWQDQAQVRRKAPHQNLQMEQNSHYQTHPP